MEVSRQNAPCACHLRGMHDAGKLQKLLTPGIHQTSLCPAVSAKSPTREVFSTAFPRAEEYSSSRTLEGVLRGQVPSLFSDLCSKNNVGRTLEHQFNSRPSSLSPSTSIPLTCRGRSAPITPSATSQSGISLKRSYSESEQAEPIDLSCKKMRSDIPNSRGDIFAIDAHLDNSSSPVRLSASSPCTLVNARTNSKGPSLLRNLLCLGKDLETSSHRFAILESNSKNRNQINGLSSVVPETLPPTDYHISRPSVESRVPSNPQHDMPAKSNGLGTTRVTLAKKNMLPVSARVSDWLVKIIRFAKSIPEFMSLLHNDKLALILNSWARLLLLYMAENNFQFAVAQDLRGEQNSQVQNKDYATSQESPTMKSVDSVQTFVRKCQNMGIDSKEYAFLRMAVLFNAGIRGLDRADIVDRLNSSVQQLLQQHVQASRPRDIMHYSRLLMSLPALYGINCKMIENLFCRHINGNMDMEVLLKEMLQNI